MGRKKIYATAAERQAAYRERMARVDLMIDRELHETLEKIAGALDTSVNSLCVSLLKYGLTNRDWQRLGLTHAKVVKGA